MTHPSVRELYQKVGFELPITPDDNLEREFYGSIMEGTERTRIDMIYRRSIRSKGEFVIFNSTIIGETLSGNKRFLSRYEEGKFDMPIFEKVFDQNSGNALPLAKVSRFETQYEFPYSPEVVKDIMARDEFNTDIGMCLDLGHVRYTIRSKESFINLPIDRLMQEVETYY
jgi:hypothetical protein